jgi:Mn-dependent DtxR family transcriptional regulator
MRDWDLEQKTSVQILLLLFEKGELKWTEILKSLRTSQHPAYKARKKLEEIQLIHGVVSNMKIMFQLTEKGRRVALKLREIEAILREGLSHLLPLCLPRLPLPALGSVICTPLL